MVWPHAMMANKCTRLVEWHRIIVDVLKRTRKCLIVKETTLSRTVWKKRIEVAYPKILDTKL